MEACGHLQQKFFIIGYRESFSRDPYLRILPSSWMASAKLLRQPQ